jgi:hypothetical protein
MMLPKKGMSAAEDELMDFLNGGSVIAVRHDVENLCGSPFRKSFESYAGERRRILTGNFSSAVFRGYG